jgi:hypothetical protein
VLDKEVEDFLNVVFQIASTLLVGAGLEDLSQFIAGSGGYGRHLFN